MLPAFRSLEPSALQRYAVLHHGVRQECPVVCCARPYCAMLEPLTALLLRLTCQGATPAASRSIGSSFCSRILSTNTGWPRTTSSPKLVMYFGSSLHASLRAAHAPPSLSINQSISIRLFLLAILLAIKSHAQAFSCCSIDHMELHPVVTLWRCSMHIWYWRTGRR